MSLSIIEIDAPANPEPPSTQKFFSSVAVGTTRGCLDPWTHLFLTSSGEVMPCCNGTPLGKITERPLHEWMNSPEIKAYREGLLTGHLQPACQTCHDRPTIPIESLIAQVRQALQAS